MKYLRRTSTVLALALTAVLAVCAGCIVPGNTFQSPLAPKTAESPLPAAMPGERAVLPTPTSAPATTPVAAFPTSIPTVSGPCIQLDQFEANLGNNVCIPARILATENWGNDFVMWLDQNPATRYIIIRSTFFLGAEGSCIRVTGVVQKDDEGRLFIRADDPGQVSPCEK